VPTEATIKDLLIKRKVEMISCMKRNKAFVTIDRWSPIELAANM